MDEPRWVSELPYTSLLTLQENVNQLALCTASLLTCLSLRCVCASASTLDRVHPHDCLSVVSFSWQVWRSPWGWLRDPEASARGELPPLWERTVVTPRGNTRSTATTLSSVTASPWTGASPTTGLKSISTFCFCSFSVMYILPPTTALHLFFPLAGLYNVRETCKRKVCHFNPSWCLLFLCAWWNWHFHQAHSVFTSFSSFFVFWWLSRTFTVSK